MRTRTLLFYFFILLFIIIAPVLTAFSLGYIVNFKTAAIEKTGGIFVKSRLARLSIFLDGAFQKETSLLSGGALLTELAPRAYLLRLEKEGYQPWFKTTTLEESMVTEFRSVILVPHAELVVRATSTKEEILRAMELNAPPQTLSLDKKNSAVDERGNVIITNVRAFFTLQDTLYLIDQNGFLARRRGTSETIDILGRPGFFLAKGLFEFIPSPQNDLAILDPSGGLFLLSSERTLSVVGGGVKKILFDKNGEKMLVVKENELFIRWIKNNPYQPFQKADSEELILRLDAPILDAAWFYDTSAHIVVRTAAGIFFMETDGRGGRNTHELVSGKTDELATSPLYPKIIFYRKNKTWMKIEL